MAKTWKVKALTVTGTATEGWKMGFTFTTPANRNGW